MTPGQALLDKAAKVCGSRYALAKRLHVSQAQLSEIANGVEGVAPGLAARLAEVAGDEARTDALEAIVQREKNPAARDALQRLFKLAPAAAAIAVTVLLGATSPTAEAASIDAHASDTRGRLYIMSTHIGHHTNALSPNSAPSVGAAAAA